MIYWRALGTERNNLYWKDVVKHCRINLRKFCVVHFFCFSPSSSVDMSQTGDKSYFIHCPCPWLLWSQAGTGGALTWCATTQGTFPSSSPSLDPWSSLQMYFQSDFFSNVWLNYLPVSFSLQSSFCFVPAGWYSPWRVGLEHSLCLCSRSCVRAAELPLCSVAVSSWAVQRSALGAAVPVLL